MNMGYIHHNSENKIFLLSTAMSYISLLFSRLIYPSTIARLIASPDKVPSPAIFSGVNSGVKVSNKMDCARSSFSRCCVSEEVGGLMYSNFESAPVIRIIFQGLSARPFKIYDIARCCGDRVCEIVICVGYFAVYILLAVYAGVEASPRFILSVVDNIDFSGWIGSCNNLPIKRSSFASVDRIRCLNIEMLDS